METIDLLRRELVRRQVTVDFTLPEPLHDDLKVGEHGPWCAPIAILRKERLRHFDLREDGKPLPILGADQNGPIAAALLEAAVMLASDPPGSVQEDVAERLGRVTKEPGPAAIVAVGELLELGEGSGEIGEMLDDATASFFLVTLAESYLLIALLPQPSGRRILKYSYDQDLGLQFGQLSGRERLAQRMGWTPLLIDIAVPVAARTPSYHAEVVIPEELRLDALIFDALSGSRLSTTTEDDVDRASLHAPGVSPDADPVLLAAVYAERSGTSTVALGVAVVTSILFLVGAAVGDLNSPLAGSSVAVLLAGSALFAATVARGGELRLVRDVFAGTRWLLTVVGLSAVAAASSVAFGASSGLQDLIWFAGGRGILSGVCMSRRRLEAGLAADAQSASVRYGRHAEHMTFSEFNKSVAKNGRLPKSGRPRAAAVVRSADGAPNRNLGVNVRAPKRVTAKRARSVRSARG